MFIWDFVADKILGQIVDWFYGQVVGFLGNFFAEMGNMGVELFEMSWVQSIVLFFSYLAWALYGTGLVVACFECGIEYSSGRGNIRETALNAIKGFMAVSLFTVVPVRLYELSVTLQGQLTAGITGYGASIGDVASDIMQEFSAVESLTDLASGPFLGFGSITSGFMILFCIILMAYAIIKVFFANLKRGGILLIQIAVGSLYIHFTEEQKQRAAAVDLEEFLRCRGEKLLSSGREKRLASDHSVTVRGNEWYDHAEERGGHAVSFVQRFYGLSYPDAVTLLLGGELGTAYPSAGERTEEPVKPFALPPANKDMRRVFAYLIKHRGIARDAVAHFAKAGLLYEDAEYHNAVFVGTDVEGVSRHAHKRSANSYGKAFRLNVEGSDPRYSFHYVGTDRSLYVFEAPIDMLSFITLYPENWQRHSYVACCGTSIQPVLQMLEQVPQLDTVLLCLDNDEAGHQASRRMQNQLEVRYSVERLIPENKDWNDDLTLNSENAQGLAMNEMR